MTTLQKHAGKDGKHKVIVLFAQFSGNTAHNLTRHQFADFHADAQRLADDLDSDVNLTGKKVDGKTIQASSEA
ncbi:hypothetical protein HPY17_19990 (plasmid) [Vibrio cholerae]|uniref:hypothetical protein n=1 Tax=Vibrio cholerae TaxID=666 RepID=UPI00158331F4|nr:hypothetical protein [Vibrio cholerae]QKU65602.1 hypothetical protein HPY17_19990 [Vibrio cholerae]